MKQIHGFIYISIYLFIFSLDLQAQNEVEYGENFIVFEAEATNSPMTKWALREPGDPQYQKYVTTVGFEPVNDTYLEYTGPWLGGPDTELVYKFICPKTADYRMLMRMHQPLREGEKHDQRNDVFVRLEGNYTSATSKPKSELEKNHKFWGRGPNRWGTCHSLEIGNHVHATYGLLEGEEYTFTMSGRSNGVSIDYIIFYEDIPGLEITGKDLVLQLPEDHRPGPNLVDPIRLEIIPDTATIREGTSMQLTTVWEPENAKKDLSWTSSADSVISVDANGVITATGKVGEKATITATSLVNDSSATSELSIVEWYPIPIESISVSPEGDTLEVGQTIELKATVWPANSDDPSVSWSSSDPLVASVDSNGVVTTFSTGRVIIRATSNANDTIYGEASIEVALFVQPSVEFDDNLKYLDRVYKTGDSILVTFSYNAGTFQSVKDLIKVRLREIKYGWQVQKDVFSADIDSLAGTDSGTVSITIPLDSVVPSYKLPHGHFYFLFVKCNYTNGQAADIGISPIQVSSAHPLESISLSPARDTLTEGSIRSLSPTFLPSNTEDTTLTWTSSNPYLASVDENGTVTAHWSGIVVIRATSQVSDTMYGEASIEIVSTVSSFTRLSNDPEFLLVYPNPSVSGYIGLMGLEPGAYRVRIFDITGAGVMGSTIRAEQNSNVRLDVSELRTGNYIVEITGNGRIYNSEFIIME